VIVVLDATTLASMAIALSARADFLVTSDRRFRTRVPSYQGVTVLSPAEFVATIGTLFQPVELS